MENEDILIYLSRGDVDLIEELKMLEAEGPYKMYPRFCAICGASFETVIPKKSTCTSECAGKLLQDVDRQLLVLKGVEWSGFHSVEKG